MTPNQQTKSRLSQAFDQLRCDGYFAEEDFACCQSCGWAAVPKEHQNKAVFYHGQDAEDLEESGAMYIAWAGDGQAICDVFNQHGIITQWNGDEDKRIYVDLNTKHMN